ncbi:MAG: amidohydrolase family protein [Acidimicrobiia bacterium]
MAFDLVIRNGMVVDGSGAERFRADIGVSGGRITAVGKLDGQAEREIDAEGHVVTPGFVDGHTHMDAQIFWDPLGTCSSYHGVTSVVMGNCGFTLAPASVEQRAIVVRNLERAEDISPAAMAAGIEWRWDTFRSYLDVVDALPKGINYAAQVGHSALRAFAMGERCVEGPATDDDLAAMERELLDAIDAGALGFTTSISAAHVMPDDRPVASRFAEWTEIDRLVRAMAGTGRGMFELAADNLSNDAEVRRTFKDRIGRLALDTGIPISYGVLAGRDEALWRDGLDFISEINAAGGRLFGQAHSRELGILMSFRTRLPFDQLPEWREVRSKPLEEQRRALTDPVSRAALIAAARDGQYGRPGAGADLRRPNYDRIQVMYRPTAGNPTVATVAAERGVHPVEAMVDLALETNFEQFFAQPNVGFDLDAVFTIMTHPHCVMTFSDSGAHVSQIMDSSIQTNLLAYWVRERQRLSFEEAIRMITSKTAATWNLADRGLVREGMVADLNVIDPDTVEPLMPVVTNDLPTGAMRLVQKARGIKHTIVAGEVIMNDGEPTGALPGRLLRA